MRSAAAHLRRPLGGALLLLAGACGPREGAPGPGAGVSAARSEMRFVVVTHGTAADPFWSVVSNGVGDAARDMGVRVDYQAITAFDMVAMRQLLDAAVASAPDGLVLSIPDADALGPSIRSAVAAGLPVISINSGDDAYRGLGILAHVGQPEYEAGYQAGERLAAAGVRHALCANHEVGNLSLDVRCRGMADALARAGGRSSVLAVDLADPEDARQRVRGALASDPSLDGILTLGTTGAEPAMRALEELGRIGQVALATFDLSPLVLRAVEEGAILFAMDQQQYLQGYLPVVLLVKYLETGTVPGGGRPIATGPHFVTRETAAGVLERSRQGVR